MFKIKKYVYRVLTVALALLVMLNTSAIGVLAESSGSREVTPGRNDYEFFGWDDYWTEDNLFEWTD